jgi:DNA (cytosine-5)-methyltransferase 1
LPELQKKKRLTLVDLFCGCGAFSYGFQQAGVEVLFGVDSEIKTRVSFKNNHMKANFICADIRNLHVYYDKGGSLVIEGEQVLCEGEDPEWFSWGYPKPDIVIGGVPCTHFSKAKKGADPEGKGMPLVNEFLKWVSIIKPKYWIMENVEGIKNYLHKREYLKKTRFKASLLEAVKYGVPQFRERYFIGNYNIPIETHTNSPTAQKTFDNRILKPWVTVRDVISDIMHLEPNSENTEIPNFNNMKSSQESMQHKLTCNFGMQKRYKKFSLDRPSCTITDMHGDAPVIEVNGKLRRLTVRECMRIQTIPDSFILYNNKTANFAMVGKAVPPVLSNHLARAIIDNQ